MSQKPTEEMEDWLPEYGYDDEEDVEEPKKDDPLEGLEDEEKNIGC